MALIDSMVNLTGTIADVAGAWQEDRPIRSVFFKPYSSVGDFAYRGVTIVAAPVIVSVASLGILLAAGWQLLNAIVQAIASIFSSSREWEVESAADKLGQSAVAAAMAGMFLVGAIISPFLNAIDLIGSAIVTAKNAISPAEDESVSTAPARSL